MRILTIDFFFLHIDINHKRKKKEKSWKTIFKKKKKVKLKVIDKHRDTVLANTALRNAVQISQHHVLPL